jgi:heme/copper-type cytochrome/quinol oxidase subunit 3
MNMPHKHKKIIEITELPEDSSPITDVSAIEKSSPAPTAKLTNTWVLPVIATLILIVSGIAAGFGYYIVTSRNTLNSQKQELINIK